jgi:ferrous iron transport protein A
MSERACDCLSFCQVKLGMKCRILDQSVYDECSQRLADLGLVPGAEFEVVREAPFGDPVEIRMNGCSLALRRQDGSQIMVEAL